MSDCCPVKHEIHENRSVTYWFVWDRISVARSNRRQSRNPWNPHRYCVRDDQRRS